MNDLRTLHGIAGGLNGLALALVIYAPRTGVACCAVAGLLLAWSAEKLRFHIVTQPRTSGDRP